MSNKSCFIGLHNYEVYKELEVKATEDDKSSVVGVNIVSRCTRCGKIKTTFVGTDSRFLDREYVYINNK